MLPLWLALALAAPTDAVRGFDRLHSDPSTLHLEPERPQLPVRFATLEIHNGHSARATVRVADVPVGELLPQATGAISEVVAGSYEVSFHFADGVVRTERVHTRPPEADAP